MAGADRDERLRNPGSAMPKLLVVLYLPADSTQWLQIDEQSLIAKRCAYWVSLKGAAVSDNTSGQTVAIPRLQLLTPATLRDIATQLSLEEDLLYVN